MKSATKARFVVGLGIVLAIVIVTGFGLSAPMLIAALACIVGSLCLARQLQPARVVDPAADYELNLLARLDDPDPEVQRQAEMERDLHNWQRSH